MTESSQEYVEDSFDFGEFNESCKISSESFDLESILQPLSHSQEAHLKELDLKDEELLKPSVPSDNQNNYVAKSSLKRCLITSQPPGLKVFKENYSLIFSQSDLCLIRDFYWDGKKRLDSSGLEDTFVSSLLSSKEEDLFTFVRYLTPEICQNNFIKYKSDFESIVNYVFYLAIFSESELLFQVLRKCLFDLLLSYGYQWVPSLESFVTVLVNIGADQDLVANEAYFFDTYEITAFPKVAKFCENKKNADKGESNKVLTVEERNEYLVRLLEIYNILLNVPGRDKDIKTADNKTWKSIIFLTSVIVQDVSCIEEPRVHAAAEDMIHSLLTLNPEEQDLQDIAELITNRFLPLAMSATCGTWEEDTCAEHMRALPGHNHHHNMLYMASILPDSHPVFKQLCVYVYIQLILNSSNVDLPGAPELPDLLRILLQHEDKWKHVSNDYQYTSWTLLQLVDMMVSPTIAKADKEEDQDLIRELTNYIEKHNIRFRSADVSNIDQTLMMEKAKEIKGCWSLFMIKAHANIKLKKQMSEVE